MAKTELVKYLLHNKNIFIFPEGTRRGENNLGNFNAGVAQIAQDTGKKVVTLAIRNTAHLLSFKNPIINVGETIIPDGREDIRALTNRIQSAVYKNYEEILLRDNKDLC